MQEIRGIMENRMPTAETVFTIWNGVCSGQHLWQRIAGDRDEKIGKVRWKRNGMSKEEHIDKQMLQCKLTMCKGQSWNITNMPGSARPSKC